MNSQQFSCISLLRNEIAGASTTPREILIHGTESLETWCEVRLSDHSRTRFMVTCSFSAYDSHHIDLKAVSEAHMTNMAVVMP